MTDNTAAIILCALPFVAVPVSCLFCWIMERFR